MVAGAPELNYEQICRIIQVSHETQDIEVHQIKPLAGGVLNELYLVDFSDESTRRNVIVKAYQGKPLDPMATASRQEIFYIQKYCHEHQGPVPAVIALIKDFEGRDVMVMEYIAGKPLTNPTVDMVEELGKALANFHLILKKTPPFMEQPSDIKALWHEFKQSIQRMRRSFFGEINYLYKLSKYAIGTLFYPSDKLLPQGLLHGDVHGGNILLQEDGSLYFIDFELSSRGTLIKDLANAACMFCIREIDGKCQFDYELYEALLRGYHSNRALSEEEIDYLPTALRDRAQLEDLANLKLALLGKPPGSPFDKDHEKALKKALKSDSMSKFHAKWRQSATDARIMQIIDPQERRPSVQDFRINRNGVFHSFHYGKFAVDFIDTQGVVIKSLPPNLEIRRR